MIKLTDKLRDEYQNLFDTCQIRPQRQNFVEEMVNQISKNKSRYAEVGNALKIPWFFIGTIHCMESSLNFSCHLHNGDPLTKRTFHVPKNRPLLGNPPFRWEVSASDALTLEGFDRIDDWSIPATLYELERYNGFGYRQKHPEVLSPYLWSFSVHYTSGKYASDGVFSSTLVSKQCGAAVLLRRMSERGVIRFDENGLPDITEDRLQSDKDELSTLAPQVVFSKSRRSDPAAKLQILLNTFPGIFVKVDGIPGPRTSTALQKVTGHFLIGDPRENTDS